MSELEQLIDRIRALASTRGSYRADAYLFVMEALERTYGVVGKRGHVTAQELLEGIRLLGRERFGPLAKDVFNAWGVHTTLDFGHIVFHLVEARLLLKTAEDELDDFIAGFDFQQAFEDGYFDHRS